MRKRRRGVEALAREEVAPRRARADLRERERRDHRRDDPELHLGEREDGVARRDRDVGRATSPAPPPSAYPCTRATTGAGHTSIASSIRRSAFASATFSSTDKPTRRTHPLDVGARAEHLPGAGEHDGARTSDVDEGL